MPSKPNQAGDKDKKSAQQKAPSTVTLINNENPETHPEKADNNPPRWHAAFKRPEWWLVAAALLTLLFVGWQAWETKEAAEATRDSVKAIQDQGKIMERQTKAAEDAATAARDNINLFISKERARLKIVMKPLKLVPQFGTVLTVDFTISVYGETAAYISETRCVAYETPLDYINDSELGEAVMFPMHSIPNVIPAKSSPVEEFAFLDFSDEHRESFLTEINIGRLFVGIRGFIKYRDVFDRERETRFRYVWKFHPMFGTISEHGDWEKCGTAEENTRHNAAQKGSNLHRKRT